MARKVANVMYASFLGKAAGADKKLLRKLEERFNQGSLRINSHEGREEIMQETLLGSSPPVGDQVLLGSSGGGLTLKLLYYLIATMNQVFPDYDFSDVHPNTFAHVSVEEAMNRVETTLFNAGVDKVGEFTRRLWERMEGAIGLGECEVYTFVEDEFEEEEEGEDPFWELGCM